MSVRLLGRIYTFVLLELLTARTGCTREAEEEEGRGKQSKKKERGAAGTESVAGQVSGVHAASVWPVRQSWFSLSFRVLCPSLRGSSSINPFRGTDLSVFDAEARIYKGA